MTVLSSILKAALVLLALLTGAQGCGDADVIVPLESWWEHVDLYVSTDAASPGAVSDGMGRERPGVESAARLTVAASLRAPSFGAA